MLVKEKELEIEVRYGLGGTCRTSLPESAVVGKAVQEIIMAVAESPQSSTSARRTAENLRNNVLGRQRQREIDVEVTEPMKSNVKSTPIGLSDILIVGNDEHSPRTDHLTFHVSESFRGGHLEA